MTKHMTGTHEEWLAARLDLLEAHMRIGVIGAGSMGGILARHLAKRGHHVSIGNSRGPESLTALAAEIGATPVSVIDAAKAGEIVIIAIPTKAVADLPRHAR